MLIDKQELERVKERLHNSEVLYQWESVAFSEQRGYVARWIGAIISGFFPVLLFIFFANIQFNSKEFWGFITLGIAGMAAVRYLFLPDHRYCYSLTQAGVHYTDQEVIPDTAYTFVRGFAWVGIAVCLLAFGLTNFRPIVKHEDVYFAEQLILFDPIKEKMLILNTELLRDPRFIGTLFFSSFDEKNHVMALIKNVHNNIDYCPLQRVNDQSKHRKYQQALKEE
ncbi:hypothetical protein NTH44_000863 [Vibrio metoecus]